MLKKIARAFNVYAQCRAYRVGLWQCPQFLFIVMGAVTVSAILASYLVASYLGAEPELVILIVFLVSLLLFIVGHIIVASFERMAESSRNKSEFISIISHQLRSPLSSIKWLLDSLKSDSSSLISIEEQNERMIHLINDLLDVSRLEDNDLALRPEEFSLAELAEKVLKEYKNFAVSSNISLKRDIKDNLPEVYADKSRIRSVMRHFIDNAVRYSLGRGEVLLKIEEKGNFLECSVKDRGLGISREDRKKIFRKFFRSPSIMRYRTEGTGIGLYIAKSIITLSGGKIGFESQKGKGSKFWFTLPIGPIRPIGHKNYEEDIVH